MVDDLSPEEQIRHMLEFDEVFLLTDEAREAERMATCQLCHRPLPEGCVTDTPESILIALEEAGQYCAVAALHMPPVSYVYYGSTIH